MRLSSNKIESRNHCTQLTVKPPPLTLSSGSVPDHKGQASTRKETKWMLRALPICLAVV